MHQPLLMVKICPYTACLGVSYYLHPSKTCQNAINPDHDPNPNPDPRKNRYNIVVNSLPRCKREKRTQLTAIEGFDAGD